ncbi:alpha kinase/elongation factor 2 kinase [Anaeramoeba flamelloides]|uniref:Alpha kinase/elongation factor 2 kinase n=1 Tax=Anaeramoeba flamelloides TaxID=1746091 RepID=A0AAV7Y5W0_9EUKA|nr:alpha kinase/elongation factor 2 kinase [Anaeramoeba flamelloides]
MYPPFVFDETINYGNSNNNIKHEIVCAIDFGTSRTGAAWMKKTSNFSRNQISPTDVTRIQLDLNDQNFKTQTAILFKKTNSNKWEPISFGKSAEKEYLKLKNNEINNYQLFNHYQMKLYGNNSKNPKIRSYSGEEWKFTQVLSGVFRFINKKFVEAVKKYYKKKKYNLDKETVRWVLTVPAICKDQEKIIMRRAFYQAGLISSKDSANLLFCYKPVGAALDFFQDNRNQLNKFKNQNLLVVDAGRGTIDITLMKPTIVNNEIEKFEILMVPKGGDFGSIYIDQEFLKFFQNFLNLNVYQFNQFKNECQKGFLKLLNQWELLIRGIEIDQMDQNCVHTIEMPSRLLRYLKKKFRIKDFEALTDQFKKRNQNSGLSEIEWDDDEDSLVILGDRIKSFFEEPIQKLQNDLNKFKQSSEILRQTDIVFFTGGLSDCQYLRKSVQKILGKNYQYYLSPYPDKSFLLGSVYFGFDPEIISIKRSQFTIRNY